MSLHNSMKKQGHFLFRWRSYLPLLMIAPLLAAFTESAQMEAWMGDQPEDLWVLFCFLFSLFGLGIRWFTVGFIPAGTSGRNAKAQRAERLNTTGIYSVVRNPLYLGNFIAILGVVLSIKVWWLAIIFSLAFWMYMERIILTEEDFLRDKFGQAYDDWAQKTPAVVPDFRLWQGPDMEFSPKTVLRREYQGLLGMGTAFFVTEFITDVLVEKEPFTYWLREDIAWPVIYSMILLFTLTLRHLKKHTDVLKVKGR